MTVVKPDKSKTTAFFGTVVPWDVDITNVSKLAKSLLQLFDSSAEGKVVHLQGRHSVHVLGRSVKSRHDPIRGRRLSEGCNQQRTVTGFEFLILSPSLDTML